VRELEARERQLHEETSMTDEKDNDETQTWKPEPPDDEVESDFYEDDDPNPRAMPDELAPRRVAAAPIDRRPPSEVEASGHVSEAIKRVGIKGVIGELLEAAIRDVKVEIVAECPQCKHVVAPHYRRCPRCEGNRNRQIVDRAAELIRELKTIAQSGDPSPQREREILAQLREYDHPDLDGLVRWCTGVRDQAERGGAKATKTKTFASRAKSW
jgi:hypothetical protein